MWRWYLEALWSKVKTWIRSDRDSARTYILDCRYATKDTILCALISIYRSDLYLSIDHIYIYISLYIIGAHVYPSTFELLSGSVTGELKFWDLRFNKVSVKTIEAHRSPMTALAVHNYAPLFARSKREDFYSFKKNRIYFNIYIYQTRCAVATRSIFIYIYNDTNTTCVCVNIFVCVSLLHLNSFHIGREGRLGHYVVFMMMIAFICIYQMNKCMIHGLDWYLLSHYIYIYILALS